MASTHLTDIRELFQLYDTNHDGNLTLNELNELLTNVARKITALPAVSSFKCSRYSLLNLLSIPRLDRTSCITAGKVHRSEIDQVGEAARDPRGQWIIR